MDIFNHFKEIMQDFFCNEDPYSFSTDIIGQASDYVISQLHLIGLYMEDCMYNEQVIFHEEDSDNEIASVSLPVDSENIIIKLTDCGKEFFGIAESVIEI